MDWVSSGSTEVDWNDVESVGIDSADANSVNTVEPGDEPVADWNEASELLTALADSSSLSIRLS